MLFKIITKCDNVYYYDNLKNCIYDKEKQLVSISGNAKYKLENRVEPFDFVDDVYPYPKKDKRIRHLKIQLGTNCNQKCAYCIQAAGNYSAIKQIPKKEDVDNFFKMLYDADIRVTDDFKIHLWGGEPLVYWKTLLYLIPKLRNFWPSAQIWFVSNGTLISPDKVEFLIENKVELAFSHDGIAQSLRGYNPLKDRELRALWYYTFAKYQEAELPFRLNAVLSEKNADLYALDDYFTLYFGNEIKYKYEDTVIAHSSNAVQFIGFSKNAEEKLIRSICQAESLSSTSIYSNHSRIANALEPMLSEMTRRLFYRVPADAIRAKCNAVDADVLSVDLKTGNVLSCHNVDQNWTMGSLLDYNSIKVDKFKHWSLRKNCPNCPYLAACKGGCARNNDEMHEISCRSRKVLAKAAFYAVFYKLLREEIKEIEDVV